MNEDGRAGQGKRHLEHLERLLLDNLNEVLFVSDSNGVFRYISPGFEKMTGIPRDAVIGLSFKELVHPKDLKRIESSWKMQLVGKGPASEKFRVIDVTGREKYVQVKGTVVRNERGEPTWSVGIIRDITSQERIELELASRNAELEKANRRLSRLHRHKDEFVAKLNHELRTPLVTGLGYVELLLEGSLGEISQKAKDALEVAARNLSRLSDLMDDILSYQAVFRPDLDGSPTPIDFSLQELVQECVAELVIRQGKPMGSIDIKIPPSLPPATGDKEMIRRVLNNLLDNCVRHGGRNVDIVVSARRSKEHVVVSIRDDGKGMDQETLKRAQEPFFKGDPSEKGSGLGLAIVKNILEQHGSALQIKSKKGKGTTMTFKLPVGGGTGKDASASVLPLYNTTQASFLEGATIMVVEDDPDTLEYLYLVLSSRGCNVVTVGSAEEALNTAFKRGSIDLFIIDLSLPGMRGDELAKRLKAHDRFCRTPVLVLTAVPEDEAVKLAGAAGCDGVIIKPSTLTELLDMTNKALEKRAASGNETDI